MTGLTPGDVLTVVGLVASLVLAIVWGIVHYRRAVKAQGGRRRVNPPRQGGGSSGWYR